MLKLDCLIVSIKFFKFAHRIMAHGGPRPGAGRPQGSKDEVSKDQREKLKEMGVDPLEIVLAKIAKEPRTTTRKHSAMTSA
jgi:hypothetical protein